MTRDADLVRVERLHRLEAEYEKLAGENESLRNTNRELGSTYRVLTEEHKTVKTEVHQLKLKKIEYEVRGWCVGGAEKRTFCRRERLAAVKQSSQSINHRHKC